MIPMRPPEGEGGSARSASGPRLRAYVMRIVQQCLACFVKFHPAS